MRSYLLVYNRRHNLGWKQMLEYGGLWLPGSVGHALKFLHFVTTSFFALCLKYFSAEIWWTISFCYGYLPMCYPCYSPTCTLAAFTLTLPTPLSSLCLTPLAYSNSVHVKISSRLHTLGPMMKNYCLP